ncbi:MAG: hypothetical protein ACJ8FZ_04730 [Bradyrhizobium sp.]
MLKYLKKFAVDIFPSVAATVIGAYIVNHYIVTRPEAPAAAAVSTVDPKADAKPGEKPSQVSNLPEAGVKAKGISERTLLERSASDKGAVIEKPQERSQDKSDQKSDQKSADQKPADTKSLDAKPAEPPAETASVPPEPRRHAPAPREKAVAKIAPAPVQPATPAVAPVTSTRNPAPSVESEERRDANDLARAAIERQRGTSDGAPRPQEAARASDAPRAPEIASVGEAPRLVTAPSVRPLPPPIMVSTPPNESPDQSSQPKPPYAASARIDDPRRPTPPAEIPLSRPPLDLRAEGAEPPAKEHTTVADDMLSAAKSVFHAVLPK